MLRKLRKLFLVIWYSLTDIENLFLYLMRFKALEILNSCNNFSISYIEELEDLLFHIKTYLEIPKALVELEYFEFKNVNIKNMIKRYNKKKLGKDKALRFTNYLLEIEKQRAVEREFIFESAKALTFGFEF